MLRPEALAALATSTFGSEWQSALARERGVAVRTVQRWAKDGIAKPETAAAIVAYLQSRRVVTLPPPPDGTPDVRDDAAYAAMAALLDTMIAAGQPLGWHPAELLTASLSCIVDRMIEGAGAPATIETLRAATSQARARIET